MELNDKNQKEVQEDFLEHTASYSLREMREKLSEVQPKQVSTRMLINLQALKHNIQELKKIINQESFNSGFQKNKLIAVVKALAYSTNPVLITPYLEKFGVDILAVSTVQEAIQLKNIAKTNLPILVMLPQVQNMNEIYENSLIPVIYSQEMLNAAIEYIQKNPNIKLDIHIKFNTGMNRTGFDYSQVNNVLMQLENYSKQITVAGICSHLACADEPSMDSITIEQINKFNQVKTQSVEWANKNNRAVPIFHIAATSGTLRFTSIAHFDAVRIGIGLYGILPFYSQKNNENCLEPAIELHSKIVQINTVLPGESIGYGATHTVQSKRKIAIIPAGYYDCIPRSLSNKGLVEICGVICPIVGNVSMDSMTVDVSDVFDAKVGSEVIIYGKKTTIEQAAIKAGTIPYELLTRIGPRVQRVLVV